jgi:DNA-binding MarR family transcriptional regulator
MTKLNPETASSQAFLPLMQELAAAYQAFSLYDAEGLRKSGSGLTPSQARVIFAIGDTDGLTCKTIGDATLITKGTLTGVIDRLEEKGLVERWSVEGDGRKTIVALTRRGARIYQREYPKHVAFLKEKFDRLSAADRKKATQLLEKVRKLF